MTAKGWPIESALAYAKRGWPVFPCHSPVAGGCTCRTPYCSSPGKHPRTPGGFKNATTDPARVRKWWENWRAANVAIATGEVSGLVVLDVDPGHGGAAALHQLTSEHGRLPRGPSVVTGNRGWHVYFRHPGEPIRSTTGQLGDGLDVRADGGYVIGPPSIHATGRQYTWRNPRLPVPDLPDWLLERLRSPQVERRPFTGPVKIDQAINAWARTALNGEADRVRSAPKGRRNHTLNRSAFCLGQIVGAGILDEHTVEQVLLHGAVRAGLGEREAILTIRSGMHAGEAHPRAPAPRPVTRAADRQLGREATIR